MKKYPDDVMKVYNLYLDYSEKVEDIIDKLQMMQERFGKKMMNLMAPMGKEVGPPADAAETEALAAFTSTAVTEPHGTGT